MGRGFKMLGVRAADHDRAKLLSIQERRKLADIISLALDAFCATKQHKTMRVKGKRK